MKTRNQAHGGREVGLAWYLVPTLCAATAVFKDRHWKIGELVEQF
jgi:hypothetical protein